MKRIIVIFVLLFNTLTVFATAQYPDIIVFENEEYSMQTNPLEIYFNTNANSRPKTRSHSTALWRGYIAKFKIEKDEMCLIDMMIPEYRKNDDGKIISEYKSIMNESFPDKNNVKAVWFTGIIVLPYGELVNYVHMGYGTTYEKYILISIKEGKVGEIKRFSHDEYVIFKNAQFEKFKLTKKYEEIFNGLTNNKKYTIEYVEQFIKEYVIEYSREFIE